MLDGAIVGRAWCAAELDGSDAHGVGLWLARDEREDAGVAGFRIFDEIDPSRPRLLYALRERHTGAGLATETARACIRGRARPACPRSERVDAPNGASVRVLEKLGSERAGRAPGAFGEVLLVALPSAQGLGRGAALGGVVPRAAARAGRSGALACDRRSRCLDPRRMARVPSTRPCPTRWPGLALVLALGALPLAALAWPPPPRVAIDHRAFAAGPVGARRIVWVGHSLVNGRDPHVPGSQNLMEKVGALARARGLGYASFDHTLWGSPLSLLYRGTAHSFERAEPRLPARWRALLGAGARYDALVLTEALPVRVNRELEHTAYYVARFACDFERHAPHGRVYVFESWSPLQAAHASDGLGSPAAFRWARRLREDRAVHEEIVERASTGAVLEPGWTGRIARWAREPVCTPSRPIFLVPVGTVLARLAERLRGERWDYDGRRLEVHDLFVNPYVEWPASWPRDLDEEEARRVLATLPRRHPNAEVDDVHASELGVYVAALVHFAVLYRQSPEGLPPLAYGLPEETARRLQRLVWETVRHDARTGVAR
ncbi:MAG TPA: GNAT family N-acetyltransferase [Sandaracinaceae bacterium]